MLACADDGAFVDFILEDRETIDDAVTRELVVDDGQMALFEGADADAGGLEIGSGEEHQLFEAGSQVALGSDLGSGFRIHEADLIGGL